SERDKPHALVVVGRALQDENGRFQGVAAAGIRYGYFEDVFSEVGVPENGSLIRLVAKDGTLLARWPAVGEHDALDAAGAALQQQLVSTQPLDRLDTPGGDYFVAHLTVSTFPAKIVVANPLQPAMAGWYARTLRSGLVLGAALL